MAFVAEGQAAPGTQLSLAKSHWLSEIVRHSVIYRTDMDAHDMMRRSPYEECVQKKSGTICGSCRSIYFFALCCGSARTRARRASPSQSA